MMKLNAHAKCILEIIFVVSGLLVSVGVLLQIDKHILGIVLD